MFNSSFIPSPPIGHWRVLVPEAALMQGSPAHYYVSPLIHDKPIQESFYSDRGVNDAAHGDEQSAMKQRLPRKHRASSTSRYPNAADPLSITTTDVPSTSVSCSLPVSQAQGTSYVDIIENRPQLTRFTDHNSPLLCSQARQSLSTPSPVPSSIDEEELLGDEEMLHYIRRQYAKKLASGATQEKLEDMLKLPEPLPPGIPSSPASKYSFVLILKPSA